MKLCTIATVIYLIIMAALLVLIILIALNSVIPKWVRTKKKMRNSIDGFVQYFVFFVLFFYRKRLKFCRAHNWLARK